MFAQFFKRTAVLKYDDQAILWGTLSPMLFVGKQALRGYFEMAFKALPGHKVTFGDQHIRVYEDIAINSGDYTFWYVKNGETKSLPARYSFVYQKRDGHWQIVDHHSSAMPAPPLPSRASVQKVTHTWVVWPKENENHQSCYSR